MTLLKFGRIQMIVASNWIDWLHQEEFEKERESGNIMQSFYRCPPLGDILEVCTPHTSLKT